MIPQIGEARLQRFEIAKSVLEHEITSFLRFSIPDESLKGLIRTTSTPTPIPKGVGGIESSGVIFIGNYFRHNPVQLEICNTKFGSGFLFISLI